MTTIHEPSKADAGWTAVRPGVWQDSTKTSQEAATELMAKRLEKSGSAATAARVRRIRKKGH